MKKVSALEYIIDIGFVHVSHLLHLTKTNVFTIKPTGKRAERQSMQRMQIRWNVEKESERKEKKCMKYIKNYFILK